MGLIILTSSCLFILIFGCVHGAFNLVENTVADIDEGSGEQLGTKKLGAVALVDTDEGSGEQPATKKIWKLAAVGKKCKH